MKAMVLNKIAPINKHSLTLMDVPVPIPPLDYTSQLWQRL